MNIRIQVMANQARQAIQQVQGDIGKLAAATAAGNAKTGGIASGMSAAGAAMVKSGSQMQWLGRQLTYNVTLPLAAAGAAGVKYANDNERAMTGLIKVYGDASMSTSQINSETTALGRTFEAMSNIYGIARSDVIDIGAAWAAAGSSGVALAKQTQLTMDLMVLGEMKAVDATQALIAIQAQYGFNTDQLTTTVAQLNNVENQTGTTMADLISSMSKSAGVAKATGVDVAHLAAMTAALVPASGGAAAAGNALKTIISRLLAPTSDAADLFKAMGVNTKDMAWQSADASTRLQILSGHFEKLSDAQKVVVSSTLASRYQLNRFDVLMDAIANHASYYYKALDAANNKTQAFQQYTYELNKVLDSSPQKFERIKTMLQNTMADAMQPMLPVLTGLGMAIAKVFQHFENLSPGLQKLIVVSLLFLALLGPVLTKLGVLKDIAGVLLQLFGFLLKPLEAVVGVIWDMVAAIAGFAWTAMVAGAEALAGVLAGPLIAAWDGVLAVAATVGVFMADMLGGFMAGVMASWAVGLTSLGSLLAGGFSVIGAGLLTTMEGIWASIEGITLIGGKTVGEVIAAAGVLWERIVATVGPLLTGAWTAIMTGMEMITAEVGYALSKIWAGAQAVFEAVVIGGARALGVAYRAVMVTMEVVTAEVGAGIAGIWRALQAVMAAIQVAGGALLRATWVAVSTALEEAVVATAAVLGAIWRGLQIAWATITVAGGKLLAIAMEGVGFVLTGIWAAMTAAQEAITEVGWSGIGQIIGRAGGFLVGLVSKIGTMLLGAFTNPWVLAAVAVGVVLYAFRDQLAGIWNSIVSFFWNAVGNVQQAFFALPKSVQASIMAVVNMVRDAALAVYHWFSYLNPFAHHSPSLVENVTAGMAAVRAQFGSLVDIKGPIDSAYVSIAKFKNAALDLAKGYASVQQAQGVSDLTKAGASQEAINSYIDLSNQVMALKDKQGQLDGAIRDQQTTVSNWQNALDIANASLKDQKDKLSDLQLTAQHYSDAMSRYSTDMSRLTSAPLVGMKAMDDAIFTNQQAQKALQLQIAQTETASLHGYATIADSVAALNGQIDTLLGKQNDLRAAGAGSEILSPITDQIKALQDQKAGFVGPTAALTQMNVQLNDLGKQANILDLQKSLDFDGLTRQINDAATGLQELPFDEVLKGVQADRVGLDQNTAAYAQATAAVLAQQDAVDQAQAASDAIQKSYDAENAKLTALKDVYSQVTQAIQDMSTAMQDAATAAQGVSGAKKTPQVIQDFNAAAGGNFADVGGTGGVGREGSAADQTAQIDAFTKDMQDKMGGVFGGIDMFGPIKDAWKSFTGWWKSTAQPVVSGFGSLFSAAFSGVGGGGGGMFSGIKDAFTKVDWAGIVSDAWKVLSKWIGDIFDFAKIIGDLLGPDVRKFFGEIVDYAKGLGSDLGQIWNDVTSRIKPFLEAVGNIIDFLKPVIAFYLGVFVVGFKMGFELLINIIKPILDFIVNIIKDAWEVIMGILDVFIGLFTGDWGRFWNGIVEIFGGTWHALVDTVVAVLGLLWAPIKTVLGWIGDLFSWLWTAAIKPVIDFIVGYFQFLGNTYMWLWNNIVYPYINLIANIFLWLWNNAIHPAINWIVGAFQWMGQVAGAAFGGLGDAIKWVWDHSIGWVFNVLQDFLNRIPGWWQNTVNSIERVWNTIMDIARRPIQFVVDVVWNNGLRSLWNTINNLWGGDDIAPFRFATGGVLPGYTPGQDVHKFYSPTGGRIDLSGGEAIMRPEFTRALGPGLIDLLNQAAISGGPDAVHKLLAEIFTQGFAGGGLVTIPDWLNSAIKVLPFGSQILGFINEISGSSGGGMFSQFANIAGVAGSRVFDKIKGLIGDLGDLAKRFGKSVINGIGSGAKNAWNFLTGPFDTGGMLAPGTAGINASGKPERVLSPNQTDSFDQLVRILDRLDVSKLDAAMNGGATGGRQVVYNDNSQTTTININGDLSFPNITDGDDAEVFIRNLGDVASGGGRR